MALVLIILIGAVVVFVRPASGDAEAVEEVSLSAASHDRAPRPRISRPVIVLYGDSLAWEAREHFVAAFRQRPDVGVVLRTFGGTAICDWLETMRADAAALVPGAVVVEFSGNALTSCMLDPSGRPLDGAAYLDRYRADAEAVVEILSSAGTRLYFTGAPRPRVVDGSDPLRGGQLDDVYREVAAAAGREHVAFVDAGAAVLDDGRWTRSLPCLPEEPCGATDGSVVPVNVVRAPDGNHFCPVGEQPESGVTGDCPVWSSGAFRYGLAMAQPVLDALP